MKRKIKFHYVSSSPNPVPLVIDLFSPGNSYGLPAYVILHPKNLAGFSACWVMQVVRSFFWLSLGVTLDPRKVVSFAPSLGTPFIPKVGII